MSGLLRTRPRTRTLRWPGGSARLGPWRAGGDLAAITLTANRTPDPDLLADGLDWLRANGFTSVVTNALGPAEAPAFADAGFTVREQLHLLAHDLQNIVKAPRPTRRVHRRMHPAVIELDQQCFDGFWRFDATGLNDAINATPFHRVRSGFARRNLVGYAITGRAGSQGYLQRIGVAPEARRDGWGTTLVADGLQWLRRNGARQALVNTQFDNDDALHLYERCGFTRLPVRLCVMERSL